MKDDFWIPVVDVAPFFAGDTAAKPAIARSFGHAMQTAGFVTVTGHGIAPRLIQDTYDTVAAFFLRPLPEKLAYVTPEVAKTRGYLPMGVESVGATLGGDNPPDLCEALVFAGLHRETAVKANIWPDQRGLRDQITTYAQAVTQLGNGLMRIAALALGLPEDHFAAAFADPSMTLRFVNYPDQHDDPAPGQLRYGGHHDYGGLTILRQDSAPGGLQVADAEGHWHDAMTPPDSFVINVGDLMARWTNGRWRSTLHRVINPPRQWAGTTRRLSMVGFHGPNEDTLVSGLPTCPPDDAPSIKAGEYVRSRILASMERLAGAS